MKKCLLFFAFFYVNFGYAQLNESFSDQNFSSSPAWQGSVLSFLVNGSGQLQPTKSDSAGMKYLVTANSLATNATWQFYVQLNFSPSASNYARIYLISDNSDLNDALHGYFIQIGENGEADSYDLFKQNGETITKVIDGKDGRASGNKVDVSIKITRDSNGKWLLFSKNKGETGYTTEGSATDANPMNTTSWFGVQCTYTKTRSDQFFFDDFLINPQAAGDTTAVPPTGGGGDFEGAEIKPNDILINEVLFNPRGDGADFVEIYNNSSETFDLKGLSVGTIKKDTLSSVKPISTSPLKFGPGQYLVLTTDPDNIRQQYVAKDPGAFQKMASMPALNNDAGTVILLRDSVYIDRFDYTEKMHFPLIKDPDGVSLERVSFGRPANEPGNFRSAAASAGYATPGYKNSQFTEINNSDDEISVVSKTFSPDDDGFEDALMVNYHFSEAGRVANILIYNDHGRMVRHLAKNMTLGQEGVISWDGLDEKNERLPAGIYIIRAEVFDLNGHVKNYRKPCILAVKL